MQSLQNRRIILGVTGGIAAYKSCELVRLFKKAGAEVRVIMTANAEKFVGPTTFQSLSGEPVLRSLGQAGYDLSATAHIDLAKWGELLIVAPASANFLAKYRQGICDDALLTEALAFQGPVLLAPAMNTRMWDAAITQENFQSLQERGVNFIGPVTGDLACGETGVGKMAEPEEIFSAAAECLAQASENKFLSGKTVLITSGPTREYIDAVRFISNRSSGKMGAAMALAAANAGAQVVLVSGPVEKIPTHANIKTIAVETGAQMLEAAQEYLASADILVAAAAVADYAPPEILAEKMPRASKELQLNLYPTTDVIGTLAQKKSPKQKIIGFAAEYGINAATFAKAREKLKNKNLDLLVFNDISRDDIGFDAEENEVWIFSPGFDPKEPIAKADKNLIAQNIFRTLEGRKYESQPTNRHIPSSSTKGPGEISPR